MSTFSHRQRQNNFQNSKNQCLGKRDKSSAGRIDPKAVDICAVLNELDAYYTTSSCAGRCFLYQGPGVKSTDGFQRYRVNHDKILEPIRYFDLTSLEEDPTGGGDPIPEIGQYENSTVVDETNNYGSTTISGSTSSEGDSIWLRFEPFILHVACRSLSAANHLMAQARPSFKNVGLTSWKDDSKYLIAIWGDEGLDMPLSMPGGRQMFGHDDDGARASWLASLVNARHERNWNKIDRFVQAIREMGALEDEIMENDESFRNNSCPRSFDVIGDIALLHSINTTDPDERREIGNTIMKKNKAIKVVVLRDSNLKGPERAPGDSGIVVVAGVRRDPLITTHTEYGIKCVVDVRHTFFTPRMGRERLRICQQVARGERVLVLFAGVSMDALQIAGRTEARSVLSVELNPIAVECAKRAHRMLVRNKACKTSGAADRLEIIEADVLDILKQPERLNYYNRVLAPRPKEGSMDGDLGTGDGGLDFLQAILPVLKQHGGECHWYDFVADHEFPQCNRTRKLIETVGLKIGLEIEVLHVASVGSVAMRQMRVCVDFRVTSL